MMALFVKVLAVLVYALVFLGLFLLVLKVAGKIRDTEGKPKLSLVLIVRNQEETLENLIRELAGLQQRTDPFEIVLVDRGSTDGTRDIMVRLARQYPLVLADYQDNSGESPLQAGVSKCRGEVISLWDLGPSPK